MRTLSSCFIVALFAGTVHSASAAQNKKASEPGFLIQTELAYESNSKEIKTGKEFILPESNRTWTPLTTPKDGVTLLGRLTEVKPDTIKMEYILVDTRTDNAVISTPAIIAPLNEKAEIGMNSDKSKVSVSLKAKRTTFWHD
ncbi:MAG: hypothetical protein A2428_10035 [Bdellovibrionales bacterium RIFOXYC1_FULL_54_43]|nr:MAG: hypothetical protein A2428_10035 [Bdellovibrionales bacterium RIFOXYC1_FULL_54_43]OFZ80522.1 MAG: hypothetical protein A2603_13130 [Bdellovibrionales bacterium RIFOXYD1_FULL_55_31]